MNRVEKTLELHRDGGLTCSQAMLTAYCESCGISAEKARVMGRPLAGGIGGRGETCGYVAAAMIILAHANDQEEEKAARKRTHPIVMEFFRRYDKKHRTTICKEILGVDIRTEEGIKKIIEEKLIDKYCCGDDGIGRDVAEILEDLL